MGVARLIAEIGVDVNPLQRGFDLAEHKADKFAAKVSRKLDKHFGVGFLAGFVSGMPTKFIEGLEKIQDESQKLHVTGEQYQLIAAGAKDAGLSVEEFTKKMERQGITLAHLIPKLEKYRPKVDYSNQDLKDLDQAKGFAASWGKMIALPFHILGSRILPGIWSERHALMGDPARAGAEILLRREGLSGDDTTTRLGIPGGDEDAKRSAKERQLAAISALLRLKDRGLRNNVEGMQDQETLIRRNEAKSNGWMWTPDYTDWQQTGAFKSSLGVSVADQTQQNLEQIADRITETNRAMEENRNKLSDIAEEIRKLREGT